MLQIVTGMYFRPVELTETLHRSVLYTNLWIHPAQAIDLQVARILPSTEWGNVATVTVEVTERLEAIAEDGRREALVATTGEQLIDELAAVLAFALNVTCSRDRDLVLRLVHSGRDSDPGFGPASILRRTFDGRVLLTESEAADLKLFLHSLLSLKRRSYEKAMRAIRRIVDATTFVSSDVSLAYTLLVAAIESLVPGKAEGFPPKWTNLESRKRERVDAAMHDLSPEQRTRIQDAILANEHLALQRRFTAFVLEHITGDFYRSEAVDAIFPIAASNLPDALRHAYDVRSRNVHALELLAPEVWVMARCADTVFLEGQHVFGLEGLARLARHVVRQFVLRAPKGVDHTFRYRSALPGIVTWPVAPEYWIWNAARFSASSAPAYLDAMLHLLLGTLSGRAQTWPVDMSAVIEKIEEKAIGLSKRSQRLPMAAIYFLWQRFAPEDRRRTPRVRLAAKFNEDLAEPSAIAFAVRVLAGQPLHWSTEALLTVADMRRADRASGRAAALPVRFDAALELMLSHQLLLDEKREEGLAALSRAVENVPGDPQLIAYEAAVRAGEDPIFNLQRFLLNLDDVITPRSGGALESKQDDS